MQKSDINYKNNRGKHYREFNKTNPPPLLSSEWHFSTSASPDHQVYHQAASYAPSKQCFHLEKAQSSLNIKKKNPQFTVFI